MLKHLTVRSKLSIIVAAVAILFGVTFYQLGSFGKKHVVTTVQAELERSSQIVSEFLNARFRQLDAGLNSLVDSPEIRAVLITDGIDHDTQLMSIIDLQHVLGADAVLYCDNKGKTLARTDNPFDEESIVTDIAMIASALEGRTKSGFWDLDGKLLLATAYPVKVDDEVKGIVMAGLDVSKDGAALRSLLLRDVIVVKDGTVLNASLPEAFDLNSLEPAQLAARVANVSTFGDLSQLPRLSAAWDAASPTSEVIAAVVTATPAEGHVVQAAVLIPEEAIYGYYRAFNQVLLMMGGLTICLSMAITFLIGQYIARQVGKTLNVLEQVAGGDLNARLTIDSRDEFGRIATALNTAITASRNTLDALATRNRDTKMLLDAVQQGFFTVDRNGVMSDERSGAVDRMFGAPDPGMKFSDFVARFDEKTAGWIEMGIEDVFADVLPIEVTIDQLPRRFRVGAKSYSIDYTPVVSSGSLQSLAVVVSDISAQVENEQLESVQREMLAMVQRLSDDKPGFMEFFTEANNLVEAIRNESKDDLVLLKRRVHTLKGNAAIFGLERVAEICHEIEDYISDNCEAPSGSAWTTLFGAWASVRGNLRRIVGERDNRIDLPHEEYEGMLKDILHSQSRDELAIRVASWRLEPTSRRMVRIAEQARALASRLGKGNINVCTRGGSLRLDPKHWGAFWSAFVHVVRNAVDHGIESPEDRRVLGKRETGCIDIATCIADEKFMISIKDDGKGINWEKVANVAREKGLPAETHEQLVQCLFEDGFSTADYVTENSGRGVGMAAVKASTESLGGRIELDSAPGQGTTFRFIFPLTSMAPDTINLLIRYSVSSPERSVCCKDLNEQFAEVSTGV